MHTARLLPVSPSMHCSGGVPGPRGVCTWSQGVYLVPGGVPSSGGVPGLVGCVPAPGGVYLVPGAVYLVPGGVPGPGRYCPGTSPSPVDRHTPVSILPCPKLHLQAVKSLRWMVVMSYEWWCACSDLVISVRVLCLFYNN